MLCLLAGSGRSVPAAPTPQGCPAQGSTAHRPRPALQEWVPQGAPFHFAASEDHGFPQNPKAGAPGAARARLELTLPARASLTSAPERSARYSLPGNGVGRAGGSRCSGESFLLATNPGVEPGAPSIAALSYLPALPAAQKTRRGRVQAAGSSASRRRRRVEPRRDTGRAGARAQPG